MKVLTVFGTRPEIIRLSVVLKILDQHCDHVTVHTGQNYEESLSDVFIRDLNVRQPNIHLGIRSSSFGDQAGQILSRMDEVLDEAKPDRVLILGDTNSGLSAIPAARRGIPVFHMEAGNRCFDNRVPEEVNRRIIDHSSTILMPYTERSRANLLSEGIEKERIYVTGNPIAEVLDQFAGQIDSSNALAEHTVSPFNYFLVTLHRAENTSDPERLRSIFSGLADIAEKFEKPVLISVHPRTSDRLAHFGMTVDASRIKLLDPLGFFDFVRLEKNALAVLTDSGTVQEECSIFRVPNVTIRDVTERPETIECGSNILAGGTAEGIVQATSLALSQPANWTPPAEYLVPNVSQTVSKIVLGYSNVRRYYS